MPFVIPFSFHLIDIFDLAKNTLNLQGEERERCERLVTRVKFLEGNEALSPDPMMANYISEELKKPESPIRKAYNTIMLRIAIEGELEKVAAQLFAADKKFVEDMAYFMRLEADLADLEKNKQAMMDAQLQDKLSAREKLLESYIFHYTELGLRAAAINTTILNCEAKKGEIRTNLLTILQSQTQLLDDHRVKTHNVLTTKINTESDRVSDIITNLKSQLEDLQKQRKDLLQSRSDSDPDVVKLSKSIEKLQAKIEVTSVYRTNLDKHIEEEEKFFESAERLGKMSAEKKEEITKGGLKDKDEVALAARNAALVAVKCRGIDKRAKELDQKNKSLDQSLLNDSVGELNPVSEDAKFSTAVMSKVLISEDGEDTDKKRKSFNREYGTNLSQLNLARKEQQKIREEQVKMRRNIQRLNEDELIGQQIHASSPDIPSVRAGDSPRLNVNTTGQCRAASFIHERGRSDGLTTNSSEDSSHSSNRNSFSPMKK